MWQLQNAVRHYPWGSHTVIPELLGEPSPADRPHAELWMGAHPDEPSVRSDGVPLDKAIAAEPELMLGPEVRRAVRRPAAVPDEGARRREAGVAAGAPHQRAGRGRLRRRGGGRGAARRPDAHLPATRSTSPRCCVALTTFEALCGFRPVEESLHCLAKLQVPELKPTIAALARGGLRVGHPAAAGAAAGPARRAGSEPWPGRRPASSPRTTPSSSTPTAGRPRWPRPTPVTRAWSSR